MTPFDEIKLLIQQGLLSDAEAALPFDTSCSSLSLSEQYYLMGLIHAKRADWSKAKGAFLRATELDEESPAVGALDMLTDIYDFYYKDNLNP